MVSGISDSDNGVITNNIENTTTKRIPRAAEAVSHRNHYHDYYYYDRNNEPSNDNDITILFERKMLSITVGLAEHVLFNYL
jgi:hypothetical protein